MKFFIPKIVDIAFEITKQNVFGEQMKKYVLLIFLVICMVSCSSYYVTRKLQTLMGSWQRSIKNNKTEFTACLTFNEDLTFSFVAKDPTVGHVNTYGDVSIMSKKMAFLSDIQCKSAGIYKYYIKDNKTLIFKLENDMCKVRKSVIEGAWTRVK